MIKESEFLVKVRVPPIFLLQEPGERGSKSHLNGAVVTAPCIQHNYSTIIKFVTDDPLSLVTDGNRIIESNPHSHLQLCPT